MARNREFHFGVVATRDLTDVGTFHHNAVVSQTLSTAAAREHKDDRSKIHQKDMYTSLERMRASNRGMKPAPMEKAYGSKPRSYAGPRQYGMNLN